jgi:hypothetical protein
LELIPELPARGSETTFSATHGLNLISDDKMVAVAVTMAAAAQR